MKSWDRNLKMQEITSVDVIETSRCPETRQKLAYSTNKKTLGPGVNQGEGGLQEMGLPRHGSHKKSSGKPMPDLQIRSVFTQFMD